jgi:ParB family transcriptional regulator, chromosome partitioning protein
MQKTNETAEVPAQQIKHIPIELIQPDKNQPRKTFSLTEVSELAESMKQHGVMQPIAVRELPEGKYTIIYGERRYRAAKLIEMAEIPAMVWDVTDEQVIEMQLTENLLRKDVHPMEEAVAFKRLLDHKSVEEIAASIGKSTRFVRDRMRLCSLSKKWQKAYHKNLISLVNVLKVAALNAKDQKELAEDKYLDDKIENDKRFEISEWDLKSYMGDLAAATWDLTEVFPKLGACSGCKFNSASALLFEVPGGKSICSNSTCYATKEELALAKNVKIHKEDPATIFISCEYLDNADIKKMQEALGIEKLYNPQEFTRRYLPEAPDHADIREEMEDDECSEKEIAEAIKEADKEYADEMKEYNDDIASGKLLKAFVVSGNRAGKVEYVSLDKKTSAQGVKASDIKEKLASGEATETDIAFEVLRMETLEKRKQEIDLNKIHYETAALVKTEENYEKILAMPVQTIDHGFALHAVIQFAEYQTRSKLREAYPFIDFSYSHGYNKEYFQKLADLPAQDIAMILRMVMIGKFGNKSSGEVGYEDTMIRLMAEYADLDIASIEAKQKEISDKRQERIAERVASLNKKK